ncbi:MAG: Succinate dehydrogenase cytochrome b558 subunit [Candidatus Anoxychlamydiales bacterium]|nr:Succinate dehydrogenase cytochrome b558 subunit [Candidatus Anoxychlamydiales bacterium]
MENIKKLPANFIIKRIQSLTGLFLTLFLFEHLLTNSMASAWIENDGNYFVKVVNNLQSIPFLHLVEVVLIGVPILFHAFLGGSYIFEAKCNSKKTNGKYPSLNYKRNKAFSWQRYTAIFIGIFLIFHVAEMRFINYPKTLKIKNEKKYFVKIKNDFNLKALVNRLNGKIYLKKDVLNFKNSPEYKILKRYNLKDKQIIVSTNSFGKATLLNVRDDFKKPIMVFLYSFFVIFSCFHAANGFWTFLITWGIIISYKSQMSALKGALLFMLIILSFGMLSIWGTYLFS